MNCRILVIFVVLFLSMLLPARSQEVDGSDINREVIAREARVLKLSIEDQAKLRAAQVKAGEDPEVQAAMKKRDEAIREYRATLRAAMIRADPSVAPIVEKVAIDGPRGTGEPRK